MKIKLKPQTLKQKYIDNKLKIKVKPQTKNPPKTKGSRYA